MDITSQQLCQRGLQLLREGKTDEADKLFDEAYQLDSNNIDALNLLGIRFYQKGDYVTAVYFLNTANSLAPNSINTLNNLGLVHNTMLQFQEGLRFCDQSIAINPNIAQAHNNRGNALKGMGKNEEAIKAYQKAISLKPNYGEALNNYGVILLEQSMPEKAIDLFQQAVLCNPKLASAFNGLGNAFTSLENAEHAFKYYERALEIDPNYLEAALNYGTSLKKFKNFQAAIECYGYALKINPQHSKTHFLLGEIYYDIADYDGAKLHYQKSLCLDASNLETQCAFAISQIPKVSRNIDEFNQSRNLFANQLNILQTYNYLASSIEVSSKIIGRHPFYLAYQAENNLPLFSQYGDICIQLAKSLQIQLSAHQAKPTFGDKIRIGIVSHYLCDHPVWHAITKGWVCQLNKNAFEIFLFNTNGNEDDETDQAKSNASGYVNCGTSIIKAGQAILDQNLDVLLYPEIGMDITTKGLACLRLAPLQATSWGHPDSTGLSTIDFYFSAKLLEPPDSEKFYKERLVKFPNFGTFLEEPKISIEDIDLTMLGINPNKPILLCAGSPAKYTPFYDEVLIKVAKRLGECQFIFFNFDESLTKILRDRLFSGFHRAKIDPEYFIKFIPFQERGAFYGLMNKADLYLDTIGFSGFNTAIQALTCKLPIVTVKGNYMRGNLGSAILSRLGAPEFICSSTEEYIELAINLILQPSLRERYVSLITDKINIVFNDLSPIRALESFLIQQIRSKE